MTPATFCTIGPRFTLRGEATDDLVPGLRVDADRRPGLGRVWGERRGAALRIRCATVDGGPFGPTEEEEILRLAARIAGRGSEPPALEVETRSPSAAEGLAADGFRAVAPGLWARSAGPFAAPAELKGRPMPEVYASPWAAPWSFTPCETALVEALCAAHGDPSAPLLDFGCGNGKHALGIEEAGYAVYGCDLAPAAVARCRRLVAHPGRFAVASGEALPWRSGSFSSVLDVGCFHSLPEALLPAAAGELARVLRPGGRLFSKMFKPRPAEWLAAQPFAARRIGLDPAAARRLLGGSFRVEILAETADSLLLRAEKTGR